MASQGLSNASTLGSEYFEMLQTMRIVQCAAPGGIPRPSPTSRSLDREYVEMPRTRRFVKYPIRYECAICLVGPQVDSITLRCGHSFCLLCLVESSKIKKECPTCKQKLPFFDHIDEDDGDGTRPFPVLALYQIEREIKIRTIFDDDGNLPLFGHYIKSDQVYPQDLLIMQELETKRVGLVNSLKNLFSRSISQDQYYSNRYQLRHLVQEINFVMVTMQMTVSRMVKYIRTEHQAIRRRRLRRRRRSRGNKNRKNSLNK